MNPETIELVRALGAVHQHIPRVINDLLVEQLPQAKQREFAELLLGLGELLHTHAETPLKPSTELILPPFAPGRHALREPPGPEPPPAT
ncbi:hypothetical protein [Amycolatopsis sp. H20-H5]|uniref:hypothetical protein n=1 Tax=Amycolatopsis sp. H20-H5 TaxID=3046309 RepID=UPI002DBAF3C0|nr:hypothetical protein [Amycolatopsis sp. H20-H5]MEC3974300.1 hypothetical protein [Amycolatopsis sp. H20-H5]